jgi:hypothetical protein
MPSPNTLHSLLPAAALPFLHSAPYTLAALVLCPVLAGLPALANVLARWRADKPRREREQIGNQALSRIGQDDPERVVELLARLPPTASPFEREPSPAEGPAPPQPPAPPDDPATGSAAGTG